MASIHARVVARGSTISPWRGHLGIPLMHGGRFKDEGHRGGVRNIKGEVDHLCRDWTRKVCLHARANPPAIGSRLPLHSLSVLGCLVECALSRYAKQASPDQKQNKRLKRSVIPSEGALELHSLQLL